MTVFSKRDFPPLPSQKTRCRRQKRSDVAGDASSLRSLGSAATINDLPEELILEIFDYLPGIDVENFQLPTLVSLSLTNSRFHRMVAKTLYVTYSSHFCEPYLFLRTMVISPQLAELVRHVDMSYGSGARRDCQRYVATAQDKKMVKEGMRTLSIPNWKSWAADCNAADSELDVLLSAVLMYTLNITSLAIHDTGSQDHQGPKWIELIRKATTGILPGRVHQFEHLRSVRVGAGRYSLSQLAPLFKLISLRQLYLRELIALDTVGGRSTAALQRVIPRYCNSLEELHLEHAFLHMGMLGVLVASSRRLRILKYDITLESILHELDAHYELGTTKLYRVLYPQKASLESLHLTCDARAEEETCGAISLFDDLRDFEKLKHMSCPLTTLIDARLDAPATFIESLPPSLRTFDTMIRKDTNDIDCLSALEHMAGSHRVDAHPLEYIRIVVPSAASWFTYDWKPLVTAFSKTGVKLVVEQEKDDEDDFSEKWDLGSTDSSQSSDKVDLYSDEE